MLIFWYLGRTIKIRCKFHKKMHKNGPLEDKIVIFPKWEISFNLVTLAANELCALSRNADKQVVETQKKKWVTVPKSPTCFIGATLLCRLQKCRLSKCPIDNFDFIWPPPVRPPQGLGALEGVRCPRRGCSARI
jgi:hypothetical protein